MLLKFQVFANRMSSCLDAYSKLYFHFCKLPVHAVCPFFYWVVIFFAFISRSFLWCKNPYPWNKLLIYFPGFHLFLELYDVFCYSEDLKIPLQANLLIWFYSFQILNIARKTFLAIWERSVSRLYMVTLLI